MLIPPQFYALGIWLFVALMNACVKGLDHAVPLSLIMTSRFMIGFMLFLPAIYRAGGLKKVLHTTHPKKQLFRSLLSMTGVGIAFYAVPLLPLSDATALWNTLAFFLLILSGPLLGEKIRLESYGICLIGFVGVLLIAHPHGAGNMIAILLMLLSAFIAATTTLTVRLMSRTDNELTIIAWLFGVSSLVSLIWWIGFSEKMPLTMNQVLLLLGAGFFGSISQLCMTRAFKALSAEVMGPYTYSGIVFSIVIGFFAFDETPTWWMLGGAILIAIGIQLSYMLSVRRKKTIILP